MPVLQHGARSSASLIIFGIDGRIRPAPFRGTSGWYRSGPSGHCRCRSHGGYKPGRTGRFAAVAFASGHSGDSAGGGDGGLGRVADAVLADAADHFVPVHFRTTPVVLVGEDGDRGLPFQVFRIVHAAFDRGERAAGFCQPDAGQHGVITDKFHDLSGEFLALRRAIADPCGVHQVGQAHQAHPNAPRALGGFFELGDGRDVFIGVDHVIQELGGEFNTVPEFFPVHGAVFQNMYGQVDRAQTAVFVGSQPLLAAGVGGFELVEVRHGVGTVGRVQEQHAGLAVVVGLGDNFIEQVTRPDRPVGPHRQAGFDRSLKRSGKLAVARVEHIGEAQIPILIILDGLHELIGDADRDVEVGDGVLIGLAAYEFLDIRMVHPQDGHIRAAPGAALGDLAEGVVIDPQESDRSGGLPGGGFDQRAFGAQTGEGKTIPAAGLLDEGGIP